MSRSFRQSVEVKSTAWSEQARCNISKKEKQNNNNKNTSETVQYIQFRFTLAVVQPAEKSSHENWKNQHDIKQSTALL